MLIKKDLLKNDCEAYFLTAKLSKKEIITHLKDVICSLGEERAKKFLSIAYSTLKESVDILYRSLEKSDVVLCAQVAHKIRGSSNLYASKVLSDLLFEFTTNPQQSINHDEKCALLMCEFELVLCILNEYS